MIKRAASFVKGLNNIPSFNQLAAHAALTERNVCVYEYRVNSRVAQSEAGPRAKRGA
jgi:hypothetical protein